MAEVMDVELSAAGSEATTNCTNISSSHSSSRDAETGDVVVERQKDGEDNGMMALGTSRSMDLQELEDQGQVFVPALCRSAETDDLMNYLLFHKDADADTLLTDWSLNLSGESNILASRHRNPEFAGSDDDISEGVLEDGDEKGLRVGGDKTADEDEDEEDEDEEEEEKPKKLKRDRKASLGADAPTREPRGGGKAGGGGGVTKTYKRPKVDEAKVLQERLKQLQDENAALQAHALVVQNRTTEVHRQREEMFAKMQTLAGSEDQTMLSELIARYTDIYSDYGKFRQKEVSFHLENLEKLLLPSATTKLGLFTLNQDKQFFQSKQSPLWESISKALEITQEQSERIQMSRERIKGVLDQLKESNSLLGLLKTAIEERHQMVDTSCAGLLHIASPKQTVLFLLWLSQNQAKLQKAVPDFADLAPDEASSTSTSTSFPSTSSSKSSSRV